MNKGLYLVPIVYSNLLVAVTNLLDLGSRLIFLTLSTLPSVENEKKVREYREDLKLGSLKKRYQVLILWTQDLRIGQANKSYIRLI